MEASTSTRPHLPATPSHESFLPSASPSGPHEPTPAPLHTLPPHLLGQPSHHSPVNANQTPTRMMGPPQVVGTPTPAQRGQGRTFHSVMGSGPGQLPPSPASNNARVYASVYSGIPVYEAMIRGISVMRRTSDSWVNATQILKVAGIPKSARTKILDKEIAAGIHEKVQGGYGKYQGTWVPFERGQDLAQQYGVTAYLAPILDYQASPETLPALPVARPDSRQGSSMAAGYNPAFMNGQNGHDGRMAPPFSSGPLHGQHPHQHPHPPPPQWSGEHMMYPPLHPQMVYGGHPPPHMYYQQQPHYPMHAQMTPDHSADMHLAPAAEVNGAGLPTSNADIYHDEYGHAHPVHVAPKMDEDAEPPAKRQKSDDSQIIEESDEDDEIPDAPPLPHQMILSTKPSRPKPSSHTARSNLLGLFSKEEEEVNVQELLGPVDAFDIDMIIDEHGHTALHWAASLAKMDIVKQLIELGADIHRGNFNGETPLARALLTTNNAETGTVSVLLEHLAPSIQTLDQSYRSVAHHVSLVSGIPGRASCARLYMAAILEWVAKEQRTSASLAQGQGHDGTNGTTGTSAALSLKALVDVQDLYGDTALNVAARMGTRGLVRLLLDAGADKSKGNKLGLRPVDFGVEPEALALSQAETVVANLKSESKKPEKRSRDVQKNIAAVFDHINETFSAELTAKQMSLNQTEQNVRHATRSLADKRQQMQRSQAALTELEQIKQKSENIRKALSSTTTLDWTGRTDSEAVSQAFRRIPAHVDQPTETNGHANGTDIQLPPQGQEGSVATLRRMREWEKRMRQVLEQRVQALEGEGLDKELKYRRLVSVCTKVPVEKVDGMLDHLATAIKSDGPSIDLSRITGFISRMKTDVAAR